MKISTKQTSKTACFTTKICQNKDQQLEFELLSLILIRSIVSTSKNENTARKTNRLHLSKKAFKKCLGVRSAVTPPFFVELRGSRVPYLQKCVAISIRVLSSTITYLITFPALKSRLCNLWTTVLSQESSRCEHIPT